jgi:hypothetical protein
MVSRLAKPHLSNDGSAEMKDEALEATKHAMDAVSLITVVGTLVNVLPSIAAAFTIVWTAFRIWETDTVRQWTNRKKDQS